MTNHTANQSTDSFDGLVRVSAALGDPGRVRLVAACLDKERCVCQLVGLLGLSPATVSKHLNLLRGAGLVESSKIGRWVYYRLSEPEAGTPEAGALALVRQLAEHSDAVREDRARMDAICGLDPSEVARRLKAGEAICPPDCC